MRKSGKLVDLNKLEAVIEEDCDGKQETPQEVEDVKNQQESSRLRKS
jgi:hypothetical protein